MENKLLIGADPEIFVLKSGNLVSAHGMLSGTKHAPQKVNKGAVQIDGNALEFNIDPAKSEQEFITNIDTVMAIMKTMIADDCEYAIQPVADFGFEYLHTLPPAALELGCDPDYNAWSVGINPRPDGEQPFRTAAGHLHLGFTEGMITNSGSYIEAVSELVRELDFYLGLPSLLLDDHPDSPRRRELYGKAGAFRPKSYGVEYRTLSNFWLKTDDLKKWAYNACHTAYDAFMDGRRLVSKYGDIQSIINTSDRKKAEKIILAEGLL